VSGPKDPNRGRPCRMNGTPTSWPDGLGRILREGAQWEAARELACAGLSPAAISTFLPVDGTWNLWIRDNHAATLARGSRGSCTGEMESNVRRALADAGCPAPSSLDEHAGVPAGWVLFQKMCGPTTAVPHDSEAGIINVLRPLHAVEIELRGGIRVERIKWLRGHPPQVRLRGDDDDLDVTIDQQTAACDDDGNYTVPMWDDPGVHRVFCGGAIASYELIGPAAHVGEFPSVHLRENGSTSLDHDHLRPHCQRCASRHRVVAQQRTDAGTRRGAWPDRLGNSTVRRAGPRIPGCRRLPDCLGRTIDAPSSQQRNQQHQLVHPHLSEPIRAAQKSGNMVRRWADAIMDASYKRLRIEPKTDGARRLWAEYKRIGAPHQEGISMNANDILLWLSARQEGSWASYKAAIEEMDTPAEGADDEPDDRELAIHQRSGSISNASHTSNSAALISPTGGASYRPLLQPPAGERLASCVARAPTNHLPK